MQSELPAPIVVRWQDKISAKDESKDGEGKKDDEADADNDEADEVRLGGSECGWGSLP
jgi:hypothetical protein